MTTTKTQSPLAKSIASIASKNLVPTSRVAMVLNNRVMATHGTTEINTWSFDSRGMLSRCSGNGSKNEVVIPNSIMEKFVAAIVEDDKAAMREIYLGLVDKYGILTTTLRPPWVSNNDLNGVIPRAVMH